MKIKDGKIAEATELEMWDEWYRSGWCDLLSFQEYLRKCEALGTKIVKEDKP